MEFNQISDNEIYLLIKYIKSVIWRVAKRLSYVEDARCLVCINLNSGISTPAGEDKIKNDILERPSLLQILRYAQLAGKKIVRIKFPVLTSTFPS